MSFFPLNNDQLEAFAPTAQRIAQAIYDNTTEATSNRVNITGPLASQGEQQHGLHLSKGEHKVIVCLSNKKSYICNGLEDVVLRIIGKINHLMIIRLDQVEHNLHSWSIAHSEDKGEH